MADSAGRRPGAVSRLVAAVGWELRCTDGRSNKYYRIVLADRVVVVNWGRIGTAGGLKVHRAASPDRGRALALSLTGDKEARGYKLARDPASFRAAGQLVDLAHAEESDEQGKAARDLVDLFTDFSAGGEGGQS